MRSLAVAIIIACLSTAVMDMAQAQQPAEGAPGQGSMVRPVDHRQPRPADVAGAEAAKPDESGVGKIIGQDNARIDRLIRSICRRGAPGERVSNQGSEFSSILITR